MRLRDDTEANGWRLVCSTPFGDANIVKDDPNRADGIRYRVDYRTDYEDSVAEFKTIEEAQEFVVSRLGSPDTWGE